MRFNVTGMSRSDDVCVSHSLVNVIRGENEMLDEILIYKKNDSFDH